MNTTFDLLRALPQNEKMWDHFKLSLYLLDNDETLRREFSYNVKKKCVHINISYKPAVLDETVESKAVAYLTQDAKSIPKILSMLLKRPLEEFKDVLHFDGDIP